MADTLAGRLKAAPSRGRRGGRASHADYRRDRVTNWIATALREAGRDEELRTLYESEARATGSYERLVKYLLETRRFEDAERWAREGIAATSEKYPGIATHLAASLCELARKRKQWDVVAAHAARPFFEHPSPSTFDELMKAARKAKVEEPVRAAALRFLETGAMPFQVISPPPAAVATPRTKSSAKKRSATTRAGRIIPGTESGRARSTEGRPRLAAADARLPHPALEPAGAVRPGTASSSGSPAGHGDRRQAAGRGAPLVRQDARRAATPRVSTTAPRPTPIASRPRCRPHTRNERSRSTRPP